MNKRAIKKKKSSTQFVLYSILALSVITTLFSLFATIYLKDSTILVTLIPCLFAECGVATGFYFWVRKVRSIIEFKYEYGEEFIENTLDDIN